MAATTAYEEQRRRQIEANKRKLEELQLHHLSAAVREASAKPSLVKKRKVRVPIDATDAMMGPTRRSGRLANLPEKAAYRESEIGSSYGSDDEAWSYTISMAEDLEQELGTRFPTFIKPMTKSYFTQLYLPTGFCQKYLPKRDETMILVDEDGGKFDTFYRALRLGLSAGWRKFVIQHNLVDGDCLVFQLIERTKFKVYIIRASSYCEKED